MNKLILFFIVLTSIACKTSRPSKSQQKTYEFLIGTYTQKGSKGVYLASFDPEAGIVKMISNSEQIESPSFLDFDKNQKHIYAVSETDAGTVEALAFEKTTGKIQKINAQPSGGAHPCHITIDATGKWVFTGNYTGGTLGLLPINEDGSLGAPVQIIQHYGNGPNTTRQEKPHVHSVNISPDNRNLFVADLGTDEIVNYAFDSEKGHLSEVQRIRVSAGSGPRHFTFHPVLPYAYVIQELTGNVTQFLYQNGKITPIDEVSTLPPDFKGSNSCADLHFSPDGKFLYGSNRFYDTIVRFSVNQTNGKLEQIDQTSVKGKVPRNFAITPDGKYLMVANQNTDNIVIFKLENGKMIDAGLELPVSMPVCVKFLKN
ncbi:MAG: lactonase family protein [Spirosomataceae bacterium]